MSTKTQTDSTQSNKSNLNFDPGSKGIYDMLTGSGAGVLNSYINNPTNNPWYNLGLGQSMKGADAAGSNNIQALLQNMKVNGIGGNAGNAFQTAMMSKIGRGNSAMRSQANIGNIMSALQRQMTATGMGMAFSPLMTGETSKGNSNSTQTTSGLGTWLPQLLGAGLGAAGSFATGGMSKMFSGGGGAAPPSPFQLPQAAFQPFPNLFPGTPGF